MEKHDTVLKAFLSHCEKTPNKVFLTQPMGGDDVKNWTFKQVLDEAKKIAGYLQRYEKGSKIAICSKNCSYWVIADIGSKLTQNRKLSAVNRILLTFVFAFFSLVGRSCLRPSLPHLDPRYSILHLGALGSKIDFYWKVGQEAMGRDEIWCSRRYR